MKRANSSLVISVVCLLSASGALAEDGIQQAVALDEEMTVAAEESTSESVDSAKSNVTDGEGVQKEAPPVVAKVADTKPQIPADAIVSQGERFAIDDKGFSIVAPQGWVVRKNLPRTSLLMQAQVSGSEYPRNIAVVRFKEPKFISADSAQQFAEHLLASFPRVSSTIEGYSLRSHEAIKMTDGREGWMFYTEYSDAGRKMMQAHVLVSSQTSHYLATFTDVAEHFEGVPNGEQFLSEAWSAMTSIELDSPSPAAGFGLRVMVGGLIGIALLMLLSTIARKFFAKRYYRSVADADESFDPPTGNATEISSIPSKPLVSVASGISGVAEKTEYTDDMIDDVVEKTVRSGFSRIVKMSTKSAVSAPDDEDLNFSSQKPTNEFKRGA
jgi:hypothetical protein